MIDATKGEWTIKINMLEGSGSRKKVPPDIVFHYGDMFCHDSKQKSPSLLK